MPARSQSIAHQLSQRRTKLPLRYSDDGVTKLMQSGRPFAQTKRNFECQPIADMIEKLSHDVAIGIHSVLAWLPELIRRCVHDIGSLYAVGRAHEWYKR